MVIRVSDDGRGLALKKLLIKAIETGHLPENAKPSNDEIAQLIFHSGVSTAEKVTSISGRGVGMEAVKAFLAKYGGRIKVVLKEKSHEKSVFVPFEMQLYLSKEMYFHGLEKNSAA